MDKNTLSNYGWIVIAVLVLSVMIALATPFGQYIENGVRSTTAGLFDTSEKALNVVGMSAGGGNSGTPTKDPALNPTGVIGTKYVYGDIIYEAEIISGNQYGASTIEEAKEIVKQQLINDTGMTWDEILGILAEQGATEDMFWESNGFTEETFEPSVLGKWTITDVVDTNKTQYSPILETINGTPVTTIGDGAFCGCTSLTSITLPEGVTIIGDNTFGGCTSLESIVIPDSVTFVYPYAFGGCTSLTNITFNGTKAQWYAITLYADEITAWNIGCPEIIVTCTDGKVFIPVWTDTWFGQ